MRRVLTIILIALALPCSAATWTVDALGDGEDAAPGDGACWSATASACTLRAAVAEADATPGPDVIFLPAGELRLDPATHGGPLVLGGVLDILGDPAGTIFPCCLGSEVVLHPGHADRSRVRLHALSLEGTQHVRAGRLELLDCNLETEPGQDFEWGLLNVTGAARVHLARGSSAGPVLVAGGQLEAEDWTFGAFYYPMAKLEVLGGSVRVERSRISGMWRGLGISGGSVSLIDTAIVDNAMWVVSGEAPLSEMEGAGVRMNGGTLLMERCIVHGNYVSHWEGPGALSGSRVLTGGGMRLLGGSATLRDTVVTHNSVSVIVETTRPVSASAFGGAFSVDAAASLRLERCTVTKNRVHALGLGGPDVSFADGGGLSGRATLSDSIVIGNTARAGSSDEEPADGGTFALLGPNLVGPGGSRSGDVAELVGGPAHLRLLPRAAPGGGPSVHAGPFWALGAASAAIDRGTAAPGLDLLHRLRPLGLASDLGAIETCDLSDGDADGDGVRDDCDICPAVSDPGQYDRDGDGVGDSCDPAPDDVGGDIDGDLVIDIADGCPLVFDPEQLDTDRDGIGDVCDLCPGTADPAQDDLDADGLGDACDDDLDGDGLDNAADPCPWTAGGPAADTDGDGEDDACDNCPALPNAGQEDLDRDGLGDACDADIDGDGVENVDDSCQGGLVPPRLDFDEDGWDDACDNCPGDPNEAQLDSDGDGLGDACDNCPHAMSFEQPDTDGDGLGDSCDDDIDGDGRPNASDSCPTDANALDQDSDGDGVDDACDVCPDTPDPSQLDSDRDRFGDACDNCPWTPNADQRNRDTDEHGDACDTCPAEPDPLQGDRDGDGIGEYCDNCPLAHNPDQEDSDRDGVGDACSPCTEVSPTPPRPGGLALLVRATASGHFILWDRSGPGPFYLAAGDLENLHAGRPPCLLRENGTGGEWAAQSVSTRATYYLVGRHCEGGLGPLGPNGTRQLPTAPCF